MIFVTMVALLLLIQNYVRLGRLINPGFFSLYDLYYYRRPFVNDDYYISGLKNQNIRDGLFGELTTEIQGYSGPLGFTYAPFWVAVNRWLMAALLIAMILLIINRIFVLAKLLPEYLADIPVYAMTILSIGGYYLSVKVLGKFTPEKAGFHATIILLVIFFIFAIALGIFLKKTFDGHIFIKDKSEKDDAEKKKRKKKFIFATIVVIVQALLFIILPSKFMIDAVKVSQEYKPNYGCFKPEKMKVRYDLEKNGFTGNFVNRAVDTEDGLYFVENEEKDGTVGEKYKYRNEYITYVRKLDKNGNITDICLLEDEEKYNINTIYIGYADDYLYASRCYSISQIDPKDGSEVEVISATKGYYIAEMCVVDNKLYYMEHPDEYPSGEKTLAWVCEIEGNTLSEPKLYASNLDRGIFDSYNRFGSATFFSDMVIGDYIVNPVYQGGRQQKYGKKYYCIEAGSHYRGENKATKLTIADDIYPWKIDSFFSIENVGGFTLYNDSLYFVLLKEDGFDLCKSDLEGSNIEVLDTYTCDKDLSKNYYQSIYKVMIGQGKIYVSAIGEVVADDEYYDYLNLHYDEIRFVTDLK